MRERARLIATEDGEDFVTGVKDTRVRLRYEDGAESDWVAYPQRLSFLCVGQCIPNGVHREGARHFLEVVDVKAERVRDISEESAMWEGATAKRMAGSAGIYDGPQAAPSFRHGFLLMWTDIYGDNARNDWCFAYTLKRATP